MMLQVIIYGVLGTVKYRKEFDSQAERRLWLNGFKEGIEYRKDTKLIMDPNDESAETLIGRIYH